MTNHELIEFDRGHLWHPYTSAVDPLPAYLVARASGTRITLADGRELIDGMASWWCAIHGHNHPMLTAAIGRQLREMAHVMFGGLTHEPAVGLARRLLDIAPGEFSHVFLADSGSVAVEVAIKMALQYQQARGRTEKTRLMTVRGGYHGDTTGAMSVTDPVSGMHRLFTGLLPKHHFLPRPEVPFGQPVGEAELAAYQAQFQQHAETTAALILEPIVQGAGGMRFYSADYLHELRTLCDRHDVLLIFDEIATGFGRTGKLFATEHAQKGSGTFNSPGASPLFQPDILCVGKALTGGTMTLSAVLATRDVAEGISATGGVLMHGPTFMGNPLACAAACASIDLLLDGDWQGNIARLERCMREGLTPCRESDEVADVRVLGGIGVVQTRRPVDVAEIQRRFVDRGVWIRPFGRLIYLMPPYMISEEEIATLCEAIREAVGHSNCFS